MNLNPGEPTRSNVTLFLKIYLLIKINKTITVICLYPTLTNKKTNYLKNLYILFFNPFFLIIMKSREGTGSAHSCVFNHCCSTTYWTLVATLLIKKIHRMKIFKCVLCYVTQSRRQIELDLSNLPGNFPFASDCNGTIFVDSVKN